MSKVDYFVRKIQTLGVITREFLGQECEIVRVLLLYKSDHPMKFSSLH